MNYNDFVEYEGKDIFNDIMDFKDDNNITKISIFQLIIGFCDENDYDIEEIGELVKKNKQFRNILKEDLKLHNEAYFGDEVKNPLGDWI